MGLNQVRVMTDTDGVAQKKQVARFERIKLNVVPLREHR